MEYWAHEAGCMYASVVYKVTSKPIYNYKQTKYSKSF